MLWNQCSELYGRMEEYQDCINILQSIDQMPETTLLVHGQIGAIIHIIDGKIHITEVEIKDIARHCGYYESSA